MEYDYSLRDDVVTKYTTVSLDNNLYYTTSFMIESVYIYMTVGYDPRSKSRWVILESAAGVILLKQAYLKFGRRTELNFNSNLLGLDYYITLKPKQEHFKPTNDYDYRDWANDFDLCFVGYNYQLTERMQRNLRIALTGN